MLINQEPNVVPLETKVANSIINSVNQAYLQLVYIQNSGIRTLWHHKTLKPEQILAEMGTDAEKVFEYHYKLTQFILQMEAEAGVTSSKIMLPPTDKSWTIHEDGTVTIDP